MTTDLERRIAKLEAARGNGDGTGDWIEREWSAEEQQLLRAALEGLHPPERLEAMVARGYRGPPPTPLSAAAREHLAEIRATLFDLPSPPRTEIP